MVKQISLAFSKVAKYDIVKVFSLTSISTIVQMVAGFISIKVVAVLIGPAAIALLGQLTNFNSIILSFATGGIISGVTKYIAESKENQSYITDLLSTAFKTILVLSSLIGLILIVLSNILSKKILLNGEYSFVFIIFGVTVVFYSGNALFLSILNGFKQFRVYVKISILSSLFGLAISLILVFCFGIKGALINAVTSQSFLFIIVFLIIKKQKYDWFTKQSLLNKFKLVVAKKYFKFTIMAFVSALTVPVSQLVIRNFLIHNFSIEQAGYWDAMTKLSTSYLSVIVSSFGVYYLPRLSELKESLELKREIIKAYKVIIPLLLVVALSIFFSRKLIILVLFSKEFSPMQYLFCGQLFGDFFKVSSWMIAFLMVAKGMIKLYVFSEIFFSLSLIGLVYLFCPMFGLKGAVIGYAVNSLAYLVFALIFVYRKV